VPRTAARTLTSRAPSLTAELRAARAAVAALEAERLIAWRKLTATMTHRQIAEKYDVKLSTVSVALKRAKDGHR